MLSTHWGMQRQGQELPIGITLTAHSNGRLQQELRQQYMGMTESIFQSRQQGVLSYVGALGIMGLLRVRFVRI